MKLVQILSHAFGATRVAGTAAARSRARRALTCECLEGRQLLNAAWAPSHAPGTLSFDHIRAYDMTGTERSTHVTEIRGIGTGHHAATKLSAQLQADFQTLRTDQETLKSEIPGTLTAAVKADQAVIEQALSSLTPSQHKALFNGTSSSTSSDPLANLSASLTAAGVSSSQVSTIVTDMQNLKSALSTTDPELQAKIAADQAAIVKDGGPSFPAHSMGLPGML